MSLKNFLKNFFFFLKNNKILLFHEFLNSEQVFWQSSQFFVTLTAFFEHLGHSGHFFRDKS